MTSPIGNKKNKVFLSGFTPLQTMEQPEKCTVSVTGFTLIELLVVVLIIAITLMAAIPLFKNTFYNIQLDSCARDMVNLMRLAAETAIAENAVIRFNLDSRGSSYWLARKNQDSGIFERIAAKFGKTCFVPEGLEIETNQSAVDFYPDGESDSARFTLSLTGRKTVVIDIKSSTGGRGISLTENAQ